jgi:hypothetical protein
MAPPADASRNADMPQPQRDQRTRDGIDTLLENIFGGEVDPGQAPTANSTR